MPDSGEYASMGDIVVDLDLQKSTEQHIIDFHLRLDDLELGYKNLTKLVKSLYMLCSSIKKEQDNIKSIVEKILLK